jgi:NAD(P)H dehydrogenase (quinone)
MCYDSSEFNFLLRRFSMIRHFAKPRMISLWTLLVYLLIATSSLAAGSSSSQGAVNPQNATALVGSTQSAEINVLVIYYSLTGNTEKIAKAVAEGAGKISGTTVIVKEVSTAAVDDLKKADAIVLGSPTYYGNMAGPLKSFIDDWYLKYSVNLNDKVGGSFSSGMDESGGKEHVLHSLNLVMLNAGMIVVGPLEPPFGTAGVAALDPVNEAALKRARALGEHVAGVARRLKIGSR